MAPGGPGVRVDSHLYAGYSVPPYYDSLLGKIIAWGRDRDEAAARMERALTETVITGVPQTVSFLRSIVADDQFRAATLRHRVHLARRGATAGSPRSPSADDGDALAEV